MSGKETILYAEDQKVQRESLSTYLRKHGYEVIEAADGEEAVEKFRESGGKVDLLLFDIMMPRMNGVEAMQNIREGSPDIRALLISGYSSAAIAEVGIAIASYAILAKPFRPDVLLQQIRTALDVPSP